MGDFTRILFHRVPKVGGKVVEFAPAEQLLYFNNQPLTVSEWVKVRDKVDATLIQARLLPNPKHSGTTPRSHGGPVKRAPWLLRPFYSKVIPHDRD